MKLLVRNLARATTEDELRQLFLPFGEVTSCVLVLDQQTGQSKGFGFVTMDDGAASAAQQALEGYRVGDRRIRVRVAAETASATAAEPVAPTTTVTVAVVAAPAPEAMVADPSPVAMVANPAPVAPQEPEDREQHEDSVPLSIAPPVQPPPAAAVPPNIWKSKTRKRPEGE